jgi:hypothetical protein
MKSCQHLIHRNYQVHVPDNEQSIRLDNYIIYIVILNISTALLVTNNRYNSLSIKKYIIVI